MMFHLTFADEAEARTALYIGGDEETPRYPALEILNPHPYPLSRDTGEVDAEGVPVLELVPGHHVNVVGDFPAALDRWRHNPLMPAVVLAGVEPDETSA